MKRLAADDEPQRRELTDSEWKNVKERLASSGRNADDEWEKFKKGFARVGINVADTVKAELFGPFRKSLSRDINDDEWKEIKKCLAKASVNADDVEVQLFATATPLRDAVNCLFGCCSIDEPRYCKGLTPRDVAKNQTTAIKHIADLNNELSGLVNTLSSASTLGKIGPMQDVFEFPKLNELVFAVQPRLHALAAELTRCRDKLMALGANRGEHLRKPHVRFWEYLTRIWFDNVGKDKHLAIFLRACSKPFFPKEIKGGAVEAFIDRYAASSK
jgi:hypothetical protein